MGLLRRSLDVLGRTALRTATRQLGQQLGQQVGRRGAPTAGPTPAAGPRPTPPPSSRTAPTDRPTVSYAAEADGQPDPGEVVWGWVPYEDDPNQGKDRPVLLLAEHRGEWLGLMLTSQDHDRDAADEARWGRHWMDVGAGGWDRQRRPSEVRLDRLLRLDPATIRREGAALDPAVFTRVVAEARRFHDLG